MSLDVHLIGEKKVVLCICKECGHPHTVEDREILFSANITHNLNKMAMEAGVYEHLWRPDEIDITTAKELIDPLKDGISLMKNDPERFKKLDSPNGWGRYVDFVPWIEKYLNACKESPDAHVEVSR